MSKLLNDIANYYNDKIESFGITPQGVDWNGTDGQFLRFEQLSKVIQTTQEFSINDIGCGYGAYSEYLATHYTKYQYFGNDLSDAMILRAKSHLANIADLDFCVAPEPHSIADYSVASGILNVKLQQNNKNWLIYIKDLIRMMNNKSRLGFSFNCLTCYSNKDKMKDNLYYADPCVLFDFCKKNFSKQVALLHDYGLYEFTIIVRK